MPRGKELTILICVNTIFAYLLVSFFRCSCNIPFAEIAPVNSHGPNTVNKIIEKWVQICTKIYRLQVGIVSIKGHQNCILNDELSESNAFLTIHLSFFFRHSNNCFVENRGKLFRLLIAWSEHKKRHFLIYWYKTNISIDKINLTHFPALALNLSVLVRQIDKNHIEYYSMNNIALSVFLSLNEKKKNRPSPFDRSKARCWKFCTNRKNCYWDLRKLLRKNIEIIKF